MAMQKLNVRFSDTAKNMISMYSPLFGCNDSDFARAAMMIGINYLGNKELNEDLTIGELKAIINDNQ